MSDNLQFNLVLVVPSLECNLLSVSQITSSLNCTVTFWPSFCIFQDILTRKTLGYGVRRGKLYYLDLTKDGEKQIGQLHLMEGDTKARDKAWLWHRRLGHLSFGYLRKLKPYLFSNLDESIFQWDTCELAKNHRVSFSPSMNKSDEPFSVIHYDVWGPLKIPSLSNAKYFVTFTDECTRMVWIFLL